MQVKIVTVQELYSEIGSGVGFTLEQLKEQMAEEMDEQELLPESRQNGYFITHRDTRYNVPLADLREFFKTHRRPEKRMSAEQEAAKYKTLYEKSQKELENLKGVVRPKEDKLHFEGDDLADGPKKDPIVELNNDAADALAEEVGGLQEPKEEESL